MEKEDKIVFSQVENRKKTKKNIIKFTFSTLQKGYVQYLGNKIA